MLADKGMKLDAVIELKVDARAEETRRPVRADDNPETLKKRLPPTASRPRRWPTITAARACFAVDGMGRSTRSAGRDRRAICPRRARTKRPANAA
jgi:hypothetical protein